MVTPYLRDYYSRISFLVIYLVSFTIVRVIVGYCFFYGILFFINEIR